MAWTTPATATAGSTALTAAFWNEQVRDNLNAVRDGTGLVPDMAGASRTTNQSINNVTWTWVTFNQEDFDTNAMFVVNETKITVKKSGIYQISGWVGFASAGAGGRYFRLEKNAGSPAGGTNFLDLNTNGNFPASGEACCLTGSRAISLAANDTVHLALYQNSGGALNATGWLTAVYIGATS